MVGDGLSAAAVHAHAAPWLPPSCRCRSARAHAGANRRRDRRRVALGDEVGALLERRAIAVLIGERPGLSSPDSLGVYLTFAPRPGRSDAERNCISNIRSEGLDHRMAAFKLAWLVREALAKSLTGVGLKDESDRAVEADSLRRIAGG